MDFWGNTPEDKLLCSYFICFPSPVGGDFGVGERRYNLPVFNELEMTKREFVFVPESGNGFHSKDAYVSYASMAPESTRGSPTN